MLYREIIAVCSEIHTKSINTLCGQNVEFRKNALITINFSQERHTGSNRRFVSFKLFSRNPLPLCMFTVYS
jgi:hypothetical protein